MHDRLTLEIAGRRLEKFISYRIEQNIYCADHTFELEVADTGTDIRDGILCRVNVNDQPVLIGVTDRVTDGDEKSGSTIRIEGRDLMGLVVDSYVTDFPDMEGATIQGLAEHLLKDVPFINRKAVLYQEGIAGASANRAMECPGDPLKFDVEKKNQHMEPGQTIFDVLKGAAMSRGAMFFSLPDGTFVFGRPKAGGKAAYTVYHSNRPESRARNNAFRTGRVRDNSRRYSNIIVIAQQQGDDTTSPEDITAKAELVDDTAPFYKPYVAILNDDCKTPDEYARMLMEMQRSESFQLTYHMRGHSQNGKLFTINELAVVKDEKRGIDGSYLVTGLTMEMSKREGPSTALRLGYPGLMR